jgi:hypothetical protein
LYQSTDSDLLIKRPFYKKYITKLSAIAKTEGQREKRNKRQNEYRKRKKQKSGRKTPKE